MRLNRHDKARNNRVFAHDIDDFSGLWCDCSNGCQVGCRLDIGLHIPQYIHIIILFFFLYFILCNGIIVLIVLVVEFVHVLVLHADGYGWFDVISTTLKNTILFMLRSFIKIWIQRAANHLHHKRCPRLSFDEDIALDDTYHSTDDTTATTATMNNTDTAAAVDADADADAANNKRGTGTAKRDALRAQERAIQAEWEEARVYQSDNGDCTNKESFLVTFPYPYMNGVLHIGHAFSLTKAVFRAQYERHLGKNVLFPFAFHCTGMPIQAVRHCVLQYFIIAMHKQYDDFSQQPTYTLILTHSLYSGGQQAQDGNGIVWLSTQISRRGSRRLGRNASPNRSSRG
jgi:tRNA synthetases class I (I, L, M and V)